MNKRLLVLSALALAVILSATPVLLAKVVVNTIDPVLTMSADGRHVTVGGPITCSETQSLDLTVTVTQRTTGAIATGHLRTFCTASEEHWEVEAAVRGNEIFEEGAATATAVALARSGHVVDDAHQWLVNVTLMPSR